MKIPVKLLPKTLTVFVSRPGSGKTTLLLNLAARFSDKTIKFVDTEGLPDEISPKNSVANTRFSYGPHQDIILIDNIEIVMRRGFYLEEIKDNAITEGQIVVATMGVLPQTRLSKEFISFLNESQLASIDNLLYIWKDDLHIIKARYPLDGKDSRKLRQL